MERTTDHLPFMAPDRFHGPDGLANGGWLAGSLASFFPAGTAVEVTLRAPTPVDTPLVIESGAGRVRLVDGDAVLAEAMPAKASPLAAPPVDWGAADLAESAWMGWWEHPLPTCFVCGHRSAGEREALNVLIHEESIAQAFRDHFFRMWDQLPAENRERAQVIAWLRSLLELQRTA